jgi:integrase
MASIRKRTWKTDGATRTAWAVDFVDQTGERHRRQFSTKREADTFRIEIETQLRSGVFRSDAQKTKVKDLAKLFLDHCKGRFERGERMTQGTLRTYRLHVRIYMLADSRASVLKIGDNRKVRFAHGVGDLTLAQLTSKAVADFRDRMRSAGVSIPTIRHVISTLHTMLEFGRLENISSINTARGVRVIGKRNEGSKKVIPPSKELVRALLNEATSDFRPLLLFAVVTGVRAGELRGLRWRHVDLGRSELRVETRIDVFGNEDDQGTKTAAGMRTIPMSELLVVALRDWRARSRFSGDDDFIFACKTGRWLAYQSMLTRRFFPLFDRVGEKHASDPDKYPKPERCTWHALRHFAISTWIEVGLSPKAIQTFAGHSTLQMTMDRYGHLFPSDNHLIAMNKISNQLSKES